MLSSRVVLTLNKRNNKLATALINQAKGLQTTIKIWMGLMTETAIFSGAIIAIRFGIKSAKRINSEVTKVNERTKLMVSVQFPT
jgi:hypothetical protein